ncbi:superoxide dismutase [Cu-Zn] SodC [Bartonella sp. HY329]|uniref:superoxide dismutase [Cu-Zn] SodC n=1 Tax=unclassified Bartonella TaxID=2645622 RepID=UPI0021C83F01|nr:MULTISPECIES: superoxide dismutase [Cu-Zn] SodC [unclassified Bartonella]UXM93867.1 superoxide dismutase [Cu-Zn] SodC [Bartonella sp. HY329]UXN08188.1 superoxide dismutase [Cu-Zn] SodC [Bartonella sp. HY328]
MQKYLATTFFLATLLIPQSLQAQTHADNKNNLTIEIFEATDQDNGSQLGTVNVEQSPYGLVFTPHIKGLTHGIHGFHVHSNADCGPKKDGDKIIPAGLAGGHLDPENTGKHSTPWDDTGHLGDLPPLYADADGNANLPVLAPKLKNLASIKNRSLMIHIGGENYSDHPHPLGGGGARMACGVIK